MQYCTGYTETCDVCIVKSFEIANSIGTDISGLPPGTYYLWVADKFGNQYVNSFVVLSMLDEVVIDISLYPEALFTDVSGSFDMFISSDPEGNNLLQFTFNNIVYNCVIFSITCPLPYMLLENEEYFLFEDGNNWQLE